MSSFVLLILLVYSEVKFYDHGVKSFEVIDNGSGIAPEDYDNVGEWSHQEVELNICNLLIEGRQL